MMKKFGIWIFLFFLLPVHALADTSTSTSTQTNTASATSDDTLSTTPEKAGCTVSEKGVFSLTDALKCAEADSGVQKFPKFLPGIEQKDVVVLREIPLFIQKLINGITLLAGGLAVLFMAVSGFRLTFGALSSDQVSQAKDGLIYGGIGLIVIIFSYVIAKTVIALTYIAG